MSSDDNSENRELFPVCMHTPFCMVTFNEVVEYVIDNYLIGNYRGTTLLTLLCIEFTLRVQQLFPHYTRIIDVPVPECVWCFFDEAVEELDRNEEMESFGYDPVDGFD